MERRRQHVDPWWWMGLICYFLFLFDAIFPCVLGYVNVFNVSTGKSGGPSERIVTNSAATPLTHGSSHATPSVAAVAVSALRRLSQSDKRGANSEASVTSGVTALAFDDAVSSGAILWAGTESGAIVAVDLDLKTGQIWTKTQRTVYASNAKSDEDRSSSSSFPFSITNLQTKTWLSREARDPTLLANAGPNLLLLFRILSEPLGALQLRRSISLAAYPAPALSASPLNLPIRSNFCPLMSFSEGACVISGSYDGGVNFFDVTRDSTRPGVNRLLGHAAPTLDVAFNYDESLLASCDASGLVIVWKKEKVAS